LKHHFYYAGTKQKGGVFLVRSSKLFDMYFKQRIYGKANEIFDSTCYELLIKGNRVIVDDPDSV